MDGFIRAVTFVSRAVGVIGALLIGFAVIVICDLVIERYLLGHTTI
jgi:TRAP-type C4-dicarboxylate transport system permease small subunit